MTGQRRAPVVVGVDGSDDARLAVDYAAWEAGRRHLPLRLVHGFLAPVPYGPGEIFVYDVGTPLRDARAMMRDATDAARDRYPGLEVIGAVVAGTPSGVLVDESRTASLVVVGSRGRGGFTELLTGSVGAQVATHAYAPVVVMRPPATETAPETPTPTMPGTGPVVVGVDGSEGSTHAVDFAFEQAQARGTALVAVYAWDVPPTRNLGPITAWHYDPDQAQAEADRVLAEAMAGWADKYPEVSVVRRAVHSLNAARTLIDESREASLTVVGPRGHGGFAALLLGSTSDALLRHAHRPVAIVHQRRTP